MAENLQQQFQVFWEQQSIGQRLVIIVLTLAGIILVPVFISWANSPDYQAAFSGVSEADAGMIIQKLEEAGISYQVNGGGTIQVPSDQVYETRMIIAREGLPESDGVGFDVFSGNTLGMTNFSQEVNYQQALETELERTISSMSSVRAVRVHIVTPEKSLLSADQAPTTASVVIDPNGGAFLDAGQVRSIAHLVSSAVEGLQPEHVAIADMHGNLLAAGQGEQGSSSASQVDSRRAAELAAAADLRLKVQSILDSALGPNRAVVQAVVSMDWTEKEVKIQSYDPETATVRSSQSVTETYTTSGELPGGIPGAETNLPENSEEAADEEQGEGEEGETTTADDDYAYLRQEETTNYEITQTETVQTYPAGQVNNISLSVLVDGVEDTGQLASIRSAVAAAAGIDPDRGDLLTVESMSFDRSYFEEQAAEMESSQQREMYFTYGTAAAAVLGVIAVFWYVQKMLNRIRTSSTQAWQPVMQPVSSLTGGQSGQSLPSPAAEGQAQLPGQNPAAQRQSSSREPQSQPQSAPPAGGEAQDHSQDIKKLTQHLANENPSEIAEVVRMWINED
jgi:flagellar M-ring protein FliF